MEPDTWVQAFAACSFFVVVVMFLFVGGAIVELFNIRRRKRRKQ